MEELINLASQFLKKVKGKLAIVFGHDCDSIASASLIYKLTKKLGLNPELIVSLHNFEIDEKTEKKLQRFKNIIVVDIGDTPEEKINKLSSLKNLLLIDHHPPKNYKCFYINPRIYDKNIYMPTSYVVWLIYKKFFDDKEIQWIAAFGTLGDFGAKSNKDLFIALRKNYPELIGNVKTEDRELFEKSLIGKIAKMVDSCRIFEGIKGVEYVTKIIANSKSYEDLLKDKKINQIYQKLEKAFKNELKKLKKRKIEIGEFIVYEIKSKLNLKSSLASYLPKVFPNKIIFVAQKSEEGYYEVSVRRGINRRVNLAKLVEEISRNIRAKGGGHPTAAGMRVDDLKELIEFLKNKKGKSCLLR
jgi:single-stranded DNA-specific DHH superfamily exonuclease